MKKTPFIKRLLCAALIAVVALAAAGCAELFDVLDVIGDVAEQYADITLDAGAVGEAPETSPTAAPAGEAAAPDEHGSYTGAEEVALFIHTYSRLPDNFITKEKARSLGWESGSLEPYAPGCCIGGDRFGNYEGLLPKAKGRTYTECDIDTLGAKSRGAKRIVFSNDGLIYYTDDHYESFKLLYGEE